MKALHIIEEDPMLCSEEKVIDTPWSNWEGSVNRLKNYLNDLPKKMEEVCFEEHEQVISKLMYEIGRQSLGIALNYYDISCDVISVGDQTYRKSIKSSSLYQTLVGPVRVERNLFSNRKKEGDGKSIVPLELKAGVVDGYWTPTAAKNALFSLAHLTPQEAEEMLLKIGGMSPSKSSLDRLPKSLHDHVEPSKIDYHKTFMKDEFIPKEAVSCSVSLDGVMVGLKSKVKDAKKPGCVWQEASCGTVSFFDSEGERLSTIYYGRMPEHKKVTLKELLQCNTKIILEKRPDLKLIHLADGAQDNWTFFDEEMPLGFQLVDFYHASQYLKNAFEKVHKDAIKAKEAFEKYRIILRDEEKGVAKVIRKLRYLRDTREDPAIQQTLTYFLNNQHRMNYAEAKKLNYPIGSGVVEAACKTLVNQRLKRSGMTWCHQGGQAILTFRALVKSNRFDKAWDQVAKYYKKSVIPFDNVIAFPDQKIN